MKPHQVVAVLSLCAASPATGFSFVPSRSQGIRPSTPAATATVTRRPRSSLSMVDTNIILGGGIAVGGVVAGIGLVAFAENMGERSKERGGGLSDDMATRITGGLMEDVEVDSVGDLSSLTDKLEAALMESGGAEQEQLQLSEEDKKRIAEEADDGW
mmetsp:Transcript_38028/g.91006  ORF Transcript_38028/g.91006 Transcript_38028/m.91006 type:complete len:157 (+) Transcript_38028:136-606(+)